MNCPICGTTNHPGAPSCVQCGARLQPGAAPAYGAPPPYGAPSPAVPPTSPYAAAAIAAPYGAPPPAAMAPGHPPAYGGYPAAAALGAIQPFGVTFDQAMSETVFKSGGWMRFLGVIGIVLSVINMLSIFALNIPGLILGGVGLWLSIVLMGAGKAFRLASATGDGNQLLMGHAKLKSFFAAYGIVAIVVLALLVVALILVLVVGAGALAAMGGGKR